MLIFINTKLLCMLINILAGLSLIRDFVLNTPAILAFVHLNIMCNHEIENFLVENEPKSVLSSIKLF